MQAKGHKDYEEEAKHLDETQVWTREQKNKLVMEEEKLKDEIISLRKEVSSALDERLLLKLQMEQMVGEDRDKMDKAELTPYFGRINFQEKHKDDLESIYIGKFGLYDSKAGDMLVLDWRAPMANIYYSGMDEEVSYQTPSGRIDGQMHLKRRYVLQEGELTEIHDEKSLQDNLLESITEGSGFLIESLNKSTSGRLTEIVATIQDQQNKIIRSDNMTPLIVQGVAGSGKTTIALHRMAYIIYNRKQDLDAQYMVVAPNKLFLNYIEGILPDLGVDNVYQTTFEDWALAQMDRTITLKAQSSIVRTPMACLSGKLRGSIVFKKIIDMKLTQLERELLPREGVKFEGVTVVTFPELSQLFLTSHLHLPLQGRIKQLGDTLKKKLINKTPIIQSGIQADYQKQINKLKQSVDDIAEVRDQIVVLYDERDAKVNSVKRQIPGFIKEYMKRFELPSAKDFYFGIYDDEEWLGQVLSRHIEPDMLHEMIGVFKENGSENQVEAEDLGPLLYGEMRLYGMEKQQKYAHIVVDEAQDLDEMKLTVLRQVSSNDAFTLVGDLSQGIYDYKGINNWERMMERAFDGKNYHYYEMTTSYRSTIEIIELANEVIKNCDEFKPLMAQPVLRHGRKPGLVRCKDDGERMVHILGDINVFKEKGMHSICVLVESEAQGQHVADQLSKAGVEAQWVHADETHYEGKVAVMTGYIAKGLEFDAVLIYDVSRKDEQITALDIKLLYVMITRALHELQLYTIGEPLDILKSLSE